MRLCLATAAFLLSGASGSWAFLLQVPSITSDYQVKFAWTPQGEAATCSTVLLAYNCENGGWNNLPAHGINDGGFSQSFPPSSPFAQQLMRQRSLHCELRAKCSSNPEVALPSVVNFVVTIENNRPVISGSVSQPTPTNQPPGGEQHTSSTEESQPSKTQSEAPATTSSSSNDTESSTSLSSSTKSQAHSSSTDLQNEATSIFSPTVLGETSSATPAAATSSPEASHSGKSKPIGAIVGGVIGGLVGLLILVNLILCLIKRRKLAAHSDGDLPSPVAYDPRRKTLQRAWNDEMNFVMGRAEEKSRMVAATPDVVGAGAAFNDSQFTGSHPSYKALLDNIDEHGYAAEKPPAQWKEPDAAAYRRASFQSRTDDGSSIYHPEVERSDSPVMRWDPNRFVRSPSPH